LADGPGCVQASGVTDPTPIGGAGGREQRLRAPANRVCRRAIAYWTVRASVGWLVILAVLVVIALANSPRPGWVVPVLVIVACAAAAHLVIMPRWRFLVHRWETTPEAVYTQTGWLRQERRIAPVSRIQTVDTDRGVFERAFRLSNLTVTTASAHGPLKIEGLDRDQATDLAGALTRATAASREDAT
jgi:uncharacterized protein